MLVKKISLSCGVGIISIIAGSCAKKDNKNVNSKLTKSYNFASVGQLNLASSFSNNTPKAFKTSEASLRLNDEPPENFCGKEYHRIYGIGTPAEREIFVGKCRIPVIIKNSYYGGGTGDIKTKLSEVETRLQGYLSRIADGYMPCLDPTWTAGNPFGRTESFPAFALHGFSLEKAFESYKSGLKVNLNKTYYLSCLDSFESGNKFKIGFGKKDNTWYITEKTGDDNQYVASIDDKETIEIFMMGGDRTIAAANPNPEEGLTQNGDGVYKSGAQIAQIISKPSEGLMGVSVLGANIGGDCGTRMIMNESALYAEANANVFLNCFTGDLMDTIATGPNNINNYTPVNPDIANLQYCMKVGGNTVEPVDGLDHCLKAGLISKDENGEIIDPFTTLGLKNFDPNVNNPKVGSVALRPFMGTLLPSDWDLTKINPIKQFNLGPNDKASYAVTGYDNNSYTFSRAEDSQEAQGIKAACNASDTEKQATFTQKFNLKLSDIIAQNAGSTPKTDSKGKTKTVDDLKVEALAYINKGIKETGATAATLSFTMSRIVGASFTSNYSGTVKFSINGVESSTFTLATPATNSEAQTTTTITIPTNLTLANDTVFSLEISGTVVLACNVSTSTIKNASARTGLPVFKWYVKK